MITKINGITPMNSINTYSSTNQPQKSTSFKGTAKFAANAVEDSRFFTDIIDFAKSKLSQILGYQSNKVTNGGMDSSWIQCKPECDAEFEKIAKDFADSKGYRLDFVPAEV